MKEELWQQRTMAKITMIKRKTTAEESEILKEIKRNTTRKREVIQVLGKKDGLTWEEDGIIYMDGRIYVPNNRKTREMILKKNHNTADIGYSGQHRMMELIKGTYWWLGLKEDIKNYVQGCFKCQQNKVQYQKKAGELHLLDISQGPWQEISIDIIGPLPKSNRMDVIVVIMD